MTAIGYTLSSEEQRPEVLVTPAARAEEVGFSFASISDHWGDIRHDWALIGSPLSPWGVAEKVVGSTRFTVSS
jgi:hypothetical protein